MAKMLTKWVGLMGECGRGGAENVIWTKFRKYLSTNRLSFKFSRTWSMSVNIEPCKPQKHVQYNDSTVGKIGDLDFVETSSGLQGRQHGHQGASF